MESRVKKSLSQAVVDFELVCQRIDEAVEVSEALQTLFAEARLTTSEAVDRRKALYRETCAKERMLAGLIQDLAEQKRRYKSLMSHLEASTLAIVEQAANLPIYDSAGIRVRAQDNSQKTLDLSLDFNTLTISNVIPNDEIKELIGSQYLIHGTYLALDTTAVRRDLEQGKALGWAKLYRGRHLRGFKPTKQEDENV